MPCVLRARVPSSRCDMSRVGRLSWRARLPLRCGILALALLLSGCATHVPQVVTPQITPKSFSGQVVGSEQVWPQADWWRTFGSAELSDLVEKAGADNRDLAVAVARVMEARAQTTIQRAALFPQINAQTQALRSRSGQSGQSINGQPYSAGNSFGLTFGASYELDLSGLARDNLRAANEAFKSARFTQQAVALTVTANVANTYFSVLVLRARIAIANEEIAAISDIL